MGNLKYIIVYNYKICDFGMGRIVEDVNTKLCLTKVGTPAYAAP